MSCNVITECNLMLQMSCISLDTNAMLRISCHVINSVSCHECHVMLCLSSGVMSYCVMSYIIIFFIEYY